MNRFKLFEEYFQDLNEGAIQVYPPNSPFTKEGSIQWTGVEKLFTQGIPQRKQGPWLDDTMMTVVLDLNDKDYDKYIADASYNSIPLKNQDKKLPIFSEEKPKYDESEFDVIKIVPNPDKPKEPYVHVADKNGLEFMVPPYKIIEIQKGASIRDRIEAGSRYRIEGKKGMIINYTPEKKVIVKLEDGSTKEFSLKDWKAGGYRPLNESDELEDSDNS